MLFLWVIWLCPANSIDSKKDTCFTTNSCNCLRLWYFWNVNKSTLIIANMSFCQIVAHKKWYIHLKRDCITIHVIQFLINVVDCYQDYMWLSNEFCFAKPVTKLGLMTNPCILRLMSSNNKEWCKKWSNNQSFQSKKSTRKHVSNKPKSTKTFARQYLVNTNTYTPTIKNRNEYQIDLLKNLHTIMLCPIGKWSVPKMLDKWRYFNRPDKMLAQCWVRRAVRNDCSWVSGKYNTAPEFSWPCSLAFLDKACKPLDMDTTNSVILWVGFCKSHNQACMLWLPQATNKKIGT